MRRTCSCCKSQSRVMDTVPTAASPSGVVIGVCLNCDRRKCGTCREPIANGGLKACPNCGAACYLASPG